LALSLRIAAADDLLYTSGHEIYLNDPRRVAAARLKTIVRIPVMKR
jgi:hypothetical protein